MSSTPADPVPHMMTRCIRPRRGVQAVAQAVGSKALILALQAGTGIVTARTLGPAGRGELAAMILWPLFLANVTTLGVPSSLIFHLRDDREERAGLVTNGFLIATVLGFAAAAAGKIFLPWWLHRYSPAVIQAAEWFLITVPICSATLVGRAVLEAAHDFTASNAIQIFTPLITLIGLLAFVAAAHISSVTAALAYIAACVPAFLYMVGRIACKSGIPPGRIGLGHVRKVLGYGVRSYGIDLLGTLALQVDQVLVVSLLSASAMGSYVVILSLSRMLNIFQTSVVMVLFPKAAGHPTEKVLEMTGHSVRVSGLVTGVCGGCVVLTGPSLLRILYGPEYVGALGALRILVLEAVLSGVTFVLAQAFMALNRPGVVTLLQTIGLSLSIPMMLLLIPRYGIYGAAIALLTSTVARLGFVLACFRLFLKTNPPNLLPVQSDIKQILFVLPNLHGERAA